MDFMGDKLCIKWDDFGKNVASSYHCLYKDKEFSDVTLVCEEEKQFKVHKIILAESSPFFRNILKKNEHSHPMIYMRGFKMKDLVAIIDFIYHGEANICQEDLNNFLIFAEELKLKGLKTKSSQSSEHIIEEKAENGAKIPIMKSEKENINDDSEFSPTSNINEDADVEDGEIKLSDIEKTLDPEATISISEEEELKTKIDSMMNKPVDGRGKFTCKECGKKLKLKVDMVKHIKTHLDLISCNLCGKACYSNATLARHVAEYHNYDEVDNLNIDTEVNTKLSGIDYLPTIEQQSELEALVCNGCGEEFQIEEDLVKHEEIHM